MTIEHLDDMSELVDADIDRVDLVGKAANGHRFLLAKSDSANILSADVVRELIKEEQGMPETAPDASDVVKEEAEVSTTTAADAEVAKEDLDASEPLAEPTVEAEGNIGVGSAAWESIDAATASKWVGILARAKNAIDILADRECAEGDEEAHQNVEHLKHASRKVSRAIEILAGYAAAASAEVAEAEFDAAQVAEAAALSEDLSAAITMYDGSVLMSGDEDAPMASEETWALFGDWDDEDYDALEKAVKNLTKKAVANSLATVEALDAIAKAGRTLSAENEAALRSASASIEAVLASLPSAPERATDDVAPEADGQIAKGDFITEALEANAAEAEAKAQKLAKAADVQNLSNDDLARLAVEGDDTDRDAALKEIGLRTLGAAHAEVDLEAADDVAEVEEDVAEGKAVEEAAEEESNEEAVEEAIEEALEEGTELNARDGAITEPADTDLEPMPAEEVGTPSGEMAKREIGEERRAELATEGKAMPDGSYPINTVGDLHNAIQSYGRASDPEAVKTHIIEQARALDAIDELPEEWKIAKSEAITETSGDKPKNKKKNAKKLVKAALKKEREATAALIKSLEDRITELSSAPAPSQVLTNGQLPPAHLMRGQDAGATSSANFADAADLRKRAASSANVADREAALAELERLAQAEWDLLRNNR